MRGQRLLLSNISEEVNDTVSTYFEAAEDHDMLEDNIVGDVDVFTWEDESWDQVLEEVEDSGDDFYSLDDIVEKPPDVLSHTRIYKSSTLPPGCRIVHEIANGNLEVWYKSADGTRFNTKAHLIAAQTSRSGPASQTHPDTKFVLTSNNINNNTSHQNFVSLTNKEPKSSEVKSSPSLSKEGKALTFEKNDEKGKKNSAESSSSYKTVHLPKKYNDEVVDDYPSSRDNKRNSSTPGEVCKDDLPQSVVQSQDTHPPSMEAKRMAVKTNKGPQLNGESSSKKLSKEKPVRCQPCNLEFSVKDITAHLISQHNCDKAKLKSCKDCKDIVLMTAYQLRKHRDLVHRIDNSTTATGEKPKGRPRKNPNLTSTPRPAYQKKGVKGKPSLSSHDKMLVDEFHPCDDLETSLNSSVENIGKIEDFLNKTASAKVDQLMIEPGEEVPKKKRGRPPLAEADKKKRSKSLGGVKAKPSPKKRKSQGKKAKVTPVKHEVISDNDPRHVTSSVNLRQNRIHSHDSSRECTMNYSLSPEKFDSMPLYKEYKVQSIEDFQKASKNKSGLKVSNMKVMSVHANEQWHK